MLFAESSKAHFAFDARVVPQTLVVLCMGSVHYTEGSQLIRHDDQDYAHLWSAPTKFSGVLKKTDHGKQVTVPGDFSLPDEMDVVALLPSGMRHFLSPLTYDFLQSGRYKEPSQVAEMFSISDPPATQMGTYSDR